MNLPNVTNLIKVDPTTNIFIINKAGSVNRPSKFIENNDTNLLVDQTTNEFTLSNSDDANLVTKFKEYNAKKISNVTVDYINNDGTEKGKKLYCIVNDNDNVNGGDDNNDEVEGVAIKTTNLSKKKNEHTNNKFVKTIKLLNKIQPSSKLLKLAHQTSTLSDNSKESINSNIDTTT